MKKVHSLPVAWCSEFEKQVTPEDMLQYRTQHPDQKLSLVCSECRLPLTFQPWIQGIVAQGYFKKRSGHNHQVCLHKLKQENPIPQDVQKLQGFEETFAETEESFKKLRYELGACHRLYSDLLQEMRPQLSLKQTKAFQSIEESFNPLKEVCMTLEEFFKKTETDHVSLRFDFKGY
jgi:hypothetical protein